MKSNIDFFSSPPSTLFYIYAAVPFLVKMFISSFIMRLFFQSQVVCILTQSLALVKLVQNVQINQVWKCVCLIVVWGCLLDYFNTLRHQNCSLTIRSPQNDKVRRKLPEAFSLCLKNVVSATQTGYQLLLGVRKCGW